MLFAQPDEILLSAKRRKSQQFNPEPALSFAVSLNADRRRIFHVLTLAEYMETWLCVPGCHEECPIQVSSNPEGFQVEYVDEKGSPTLLAGSYQMFRTAKTNILWRRTGARQSEPSLVKIRLIGDFERTTLCLTHSGLNAREDLHWHSQLWAQSLEKLASLFELQ
jgi:uncharacterized protein YndB with AHSA1/START domain